MSALEAAAEWAASSGPPNWAFVLALLTHPKVWSDAAVKHARKRLGGDSSDAGGEDGA
ncbi:hypothetical protein [Haloparvum sedimenti]|uniref:hypothetical protein n=1 Tax=Haloparvum sedimenti TaxID=1678448 RepID=UPI00159EDEB5|nr:hypothetical protein [Haloparvum sedimenti]